MKAQEPPSPKFDLEASNFPPLPGSVVSIQGETTPEMRLSDVVRGLKVTNKVDIQTSFTLFFNCSTHPDPHFESSFISACLQRG